MDENKIASSESQFTNDLYSIVSIARERAYRAANSMQIASNWLIGWRIAEQEKMGQARAEYGKHIVQLASDALTKKFGSGYSLTTVKNCVRFYTLFPDFSIGQALSDQLKNHELSIGQALSDQSPTSVAHKSLPLQLSWSLLICSVDIAVSFLSRR